MFFPKLKQSLIQSKTENEGLRRDNADLQAHIALPFSTLANSRQHCPNCSRWKAPI